MAGEEKEGVLEVLVSQMSEFEADVSRIQAILSWTVLSWTVENQLDQFSGPTIN
jgi:hypothetical protein